MRRWYSVLCISIMLFLLAWHLSPATAQVSSLANKKLEQLPIGYVFTLQASVTRAASLTTPAVTGLGPFRHLIATWNITSAERDSADETYDLYITCGDGVSTWDVIHFPQVVTTGAKRYTATVVGDIVPQEITTATPGVAANVSGTLKTDTAGAGEGIRTLTAGKVRHGPWGDRCGAELVVGGTVVTGIAYSVTLTVK